MGQKILLLGQKVQKKFRKVWKVQKSLEVRKSLDKVWKQEFANIQNLWKIHNLFYSKLSENYEKMILKWNFGNREKLVLTQKPTRMFGLKFGMQGLT